jgi:predicted SnoaL-like aldol condensation-catalyzing enzyme
MAKKSKRGVKVAKRPKAKARTRPKAGMKAKAGKLLARIGAKVSRAGAKAKASARRTLRKASTRKHSAADQLARNKQLVLAFYHKIIGEKDYEGARQYMGTEYRQHAPYATDGHTGIAEWLRKFKEAFPQHRYEVKKVIAEGDLVVLHLHGMNGPNPHGESVVDIFRIENGKVVEHWDVIQPIPETADNANSMF